MEFCSGVPLQALTASAKEKGRCSPWILICQVRRHILSTSHTGHSLWACSFLALPILPISLLFEACRSFQSSKRGGFLCPRVTCRHES